MSLGRVWLFVLFSVAVLHRFVVLSLFLCPVVLSVVLQTERYNSTVVLCPLYSSFVPLCIFWALLFVEETWL